MASKLMRKPKLGWNKTTVIASLLMGAIILMMITNSIIEFVSTSGKERLFKPPVPVESECRHTQQGKTLVADERGYVCKWDNVVNGCCVGVSEEDRFPCRDCRNETSCCMEYEQCVACCLDPVNRDVIFDILATTHNVIFKSVTTKFEFCQARCRTSSSSVVGHKTYYSDEKHCFGHFNLPQSHHPPRQLFPSTQMTQSRPPVLLGHISPEVQDQDQPEQQQATAESGNLEKQFDSAKALGDDQNLAVIIADTDLHMVQLGKEAVEQVDWVAASPYFQARGMIDSETTAGAAGGSFTTAHALLLFASVVTIFSFFYCLDVQSIQNSPKSKKVKLN